MIYVFVQNHLTVLEKGGHLKEILALIIFLKDLQRRDFLLKEVSITILECVKINQKTNNF